MSCRHLEKRRLRKRRLLPFRRYTFQRPDRSKRPWRGTYPLRTRYRRPHRLLREKHNLRKWPQRSSHPKHSRHPSDHNRRRRKSCRNLGNPRPGPYSQHPVLLPSMSRRSSRHRYNYLRHRLCCRHGKGRRGRHTVPSFGHRHMCPQVDNKRLLAEVRRTRRLRKQCRSPDRDLQCAGGTIRQEDSLYIPLLRLQSRSHQSRSRHRLPSTPRRHCRRQDSCLRHCRNRPPFGLDTRVHPRSRRPGRRLPDRP